MAGTQRTAMFGKLAAKGGLFTIEDMSRSTGNRFFVDSGASGVGSTARYGTSPEKPLSSLALAFSLNILTANNGDIVYLMPGHTEAVIAAGTITCDIAGVTVVGLGEKDTRPIISFTTIDSADIEIDAADITFENISFRCDIASLVAAIDVDASGFTMRNCSFMGTDAADEAFLITVITDAAADDLTIEDCQFHYLNAEDGTAITTTSTECIRLVGADRAKIRRNYISGDFTTSAINSITTASDDILILNNYIQNIATENIAGGIDLHASTTGFMDGNVLYVDDPTSPEDAIDDGSCANGVNWVSNAIGDAPIMWGAADALGVEGKIDVIDGYHDVGTPDAVTNTQMRDVIGNKTDAAAAGAVSATESIMAYAKQLVGELIVVDSYHDVPSADSGDDAQMRDVIGKKDDAAAAGAVSTVESIMAYAKQLVGELIVVDGYHDVGTPDAVTNAQMRDVVGNKTDAGVQDIAADKSALAYLKGALDILAGTAGIATWKAAAAPANAVSLSEALRYISENQSERIAIKSTGDLTAFGTSMNLFTVTGDVWCRVSASMDVAVTSTSGTTTFEVGVAGNTASLCVQDAVDNTAFAIGDSWSLQTAPDANGALIADAWTLVGNGATIILTGSVDDITAGDMDLYCQYIPASTDGAVVAA